MMYPHYVYEALVRDQQARLAAQAARYSRMRPPSRWSFARRRRAGGAEPHHVALRPEGVTPCEPPAALPPAA